MISSPSTNRSRAPSDAFDEHLAHALMHAAATGDVDTVKNVVSEAGSLKLCPSAIEGDKTSYFVIYTAYAYFSGSRKRAIKRY